VPNPTPQHVIVTPTKSMGVAILLTVLFGPLGMLYATIPGALLMIVVGGVLALMTLGISLLITWPICVIWAAVAVNNYNGRLLAGRQRI